MVRALAVPGLTPEVLRVLYLEEHLTEMQIASRFGIGQVQVGRLRKRWGIATLSMGDRVGLGLPDLTDFQKQLLVGSLLGDGWMRATSPQSACFNEGHCIEQSSYTDWKAHIMEPFTSRMYPTVKKGGKRDFHGWYLATHSCPQLRPYYDLFYPSPDYQRVFPESLPDLMTPFVLAVWYMDDGSVTQRGEPILSFGLDTLSLSRACHALRHLGLNPKVYGTGGDVSIQFPKQTLLFKSLVQSHMPECMHYKMPFETQGQAIHRRARVLTPAEAKALYDGGLSVDQIAKTFHVGTSTVNRRLSLAATLKRTSGPRKVKYDLKHASLVLGRYDVNQFPTLTSTEQEQWVDEVLAVLRASPFPYGGDLSLDKVESEFRALCQASMVLVGDSIDPIRRVGISLCSPHFPNRYAARSRGTRSAYEAWHQDKALKGAIRFQFKVGDPVTPHRVLKALTMQCRTPSIFRPTVAKYIYDNYCPKGGATWDPCAGYGGRMLGALAAGVRYIGTDVEPETVEGNKLLANLVGMHAEIHLCPAEDFDPPFVDLVFTSPPYFNRELYSHGVSQSWVKYSEFDLWIEGFLRVLIRKAKHSLNPNGHLVLNVADIKDRGVAVPMVERTIEVAVQEGFTLLERLKMPLPKLNRVDPHEPILVFKIGMLHNPNS